MGRTSSKINKKLEDIISSNTLPRCAASKVKKLQRSVLEKTLTTTKSAEFTTSTPAKSGPGSVNDSPLRSMITLSDTNSLKNFSEQNLNLEDSGYFDSNLTHLDDTLSDSTIYDFKEEYSEETEEYSLPLRPLYFEVPGTCNVLERSRVLDQLEHYLLDHRGAILTGGPSSGKSSVLVDLIQGSHFGANMAKGHPLAHHTLAFHFIQQGDSSTADIPKFIQSLAAQLSQHPALRAYRDLLNNQPELRELLTIPALCREPSLGLQQGILEPLRELYHHEKLNIDFGLIVVDGLDMEDDEIMKITTIAEFLTMNILRFPSFLKLIVSQRTSNSELTELMHLPKLNLGLTEGEFTEENRTDLQEYIENRIFSTASILSNIIPTETRRKTKLTVKLVEFIVTRNSYLFAKLFLDLLEIGYITIKSDSFKSLPQSQEEIFHLLLSFRYPTSSSYKLMSQFISILLATSRPLNLTEVASILDIDLNALRTEYNKVKDLIITRSDGSIMFIHPSLSQWLRTDGHRFSTQPNHNQFVLYMDKNRILAQPTDIEEFLQHLVKSELLNLECPYFSDRDRQVLYTTYKVERRTLKKVYKHLRHLYRSDTDIMRLISISLGKAQRTE